MRDVMKIRNYPVQVEWSDEDGAYVGYVPGLLIGGVCHADTERDVRNQLEGIIDDVLEDYKERGISAPVPSIRAARINANINQARAARAALRVTQKQFADMMEISVGTVRNWEQERSTPSGAASAFLKVASRSPEAVLKALQEA